MTKDRYVVELRDAAIYHADDPFGSRSEEKLIRQGEMVLSEVNLTVAPGEFVFLIGRVRIGIVFQDYQLLTDRNVFMNLHYVLKATGWKREQEIRERIDKVLEVVQLGHKSYKMPFELSGGEQQRLVIARALLNDPEVLLADEPTGNLDPVTADGIMQLFRQIAARGCAVVMSTHNTALIENYPARAILFAQGKIREVNLEEELG